MARLSPGSRHSWHTRHRPAEGELVEHYTFVHKNVKNIHFSDINLFQYKCDVCNKTFKTEAGPKNHQKGGHCPTVDCRRCGAILAKSLIHQHLLVCPVPVVGGRVRENDGEGEENDGRVEEVILVEGVTDEGGVVEAMMAEEVVLVEGLVVDGVVVERVMEEGGVGEDVMVDSVMVDSVMVDSVWDVDVVQQCNDLMMQLSEGDMNSGTSDLHMPVAPADVSADFDASEDDDDDDEDWIDN